MIWQNCIIFRPKSTSFYDLTKLYYFFGSRFNDLTKLYYFQIKINFIRWFDKIRLFFSDQDRLHSMIIETGRGAWAKRPKKVAVQGHAVEVLHHQRKESMDTIITSKAKFLFYFSSFNFSMYISILKSTQCTLLVLIDFCPV